MNVFLSCERESHMLNMREGRQKVVVLKMMALNLAPTLQQKAGGYIKLEA